MKTKESLQYVMNFVNDLYDTSEGSCMPELKAEELERLNDFCTSICSESISTNLLIIMIGCMTDDDAVAPDNIAEGIFEHLDGLQQLSDQRQNEIYDAIHTLASCLIKEPGQYL